MRKGQTQAVTAVLMTGVMIGAVASAYVWGTPLLEKREAEAEVKQLHNDVVALQEEAEYISEAGELAASEEELRVEDGTVNVGGKKITIEMPADTSLYPNGGWQLISGRGRISGNGSLGIHSRTAAFAQVDGDNVVYELRFRDLQASQGGETQTEAISLNAQGGSSSSGSTVVVIENQGSQVSSDGEEIETSLGVSLR